MSISGWIASDNVVHMHNEISFTFKEKQNSYLYRQMDETEKAYPESGNSGP